MEHDTTRPARLHQRAVQWFFRMLGAAHTQDQYLQRERQRSDGVVRSADDPEAFQRQGQQYQQFIQQQQERMRHGRPY
jgi:hypothetical protein